MKKIDIAKRNETNFNLAVNFMVIENVVKLMGVYDRMCDEHEFIEKVFKLASNFELANVLYKHAEDGNSEFFTTYLDMMDELFGLDKDVFLGYRQIELGIDVDKDMPELLNMAHTSLENVSDWADLFMVYNIPAYYRYDSTDVVVHKKKAILEYEIEEVIEKTINNGIGKMVYNNSFGDMKQALGGLSVNPLGINHLGIFVKLYKDHYISAMDNEDDAFEKELDDIFEAIFTPMNIVERELESDKKQGSKYALQPSLSNTYGHWNDNIYSLKSLITNLLINGSPDDYRDSFENLISKKKSEENSTNYADIKSMDKYVYFDDAVEGKRYLPFPLELDEEKSELLDLMRTLYNSGYNDGIQLSELIRVSTIKDELNYWSAEKEKAQNGMLSLLEKRSQFGETIDDMAKVEIAMLLAEEKRLSDRYTWIKEEVIPELQQSQEAFEVDAKNWAKDKFETLKVEIDTLKEELKHIKVAMKTAEEEEKINLQRQFEQLETKRVTWAVIYKKLNKMIKTNKIKPIVAAIEPYYKSISFATYNDGEKRKSVNLEKRYKNQYKISKEN